MARTCQLTRGGASVRAQWTLDDEALLVTADGGLAEAYRLGEVTGIGGDEYTIEIKLGDDTVALSRPGSEGSTLLASLRRAWLPKRAAALRLAGSGEPKRFAGAVALDGAPPRHASMLLFEDALLVAPDGADVEPLFLALFAGAGLDQAAMVVRLEGWDGTAAVFSKLGGQTQEFADAVRGRRSHLAEEATELLARMLPTLPVAVRTTLAARWLPGRVVARAELEKLCPGFAQAFAASWLAAMPRRVYGEVLLSWAEPDQVFLGYGRPGSQVPPAPSGEEEPAEEGEAATAPRAAPQSPEESQPLWLLVGRGELWFLEAVSEQDWATYRFAAGPEMPALASRLMCAPQFSREALYLSLERLVGTRGELAIAARDLAFLRALRERFRGRVIHSGLERWRTALTAA